ncbi:hypothetical protein SO802_020256 [Lithocarpus litseifolius]|uniref:GH18 domain-containing protein n=1 Tax=Lithocarpus litseifolius TaxID=425828 RepID=A0AAW2CBA1_9ROSI
MRGIVSVGLSVQNLVSTRANFTICNIALFHPNPMAVIRGGYWRSSEADNFPPDSIQTTYFTHLYYATVAIHPDTYKITPISPNDKKWMKDFTSMAQKAGVKCLLSIGEDTDQSRVAFSNMIRTPDDRKSFIDSTIEVVKDYGFDGLDLFWKYPDTETEFQMPNLFLLFKEWRESLDESSKSEKPEKSQYLLSTIAYFAPKFFPPKDDKAYPFKAIKDNVDFVNLVCYDYYGSQDFYVTAEHALLYDKKCRKSTHYGISSWINDTGIPDGKLVMGLPLYGRTWKLKYTTKNWIGAPATGVGPVMDYNDIMKFNDRHAHVVDDDKTVSAYSYDGYDWVGYDSTKSIKGKVQYAKDHELGGYFFWALGMDKDYILPKQALETWK